MIQSSVILTPLKPLNQNNVAMCLYCECDNILFQKD